MENMGPAVAAIELVDRQLTFDIVVNVMDVTGGTASGETQHRMNCFCRGSRLLHEYQDCNSLQMELTTLE